MSMLQWELSDADEPGVAILGLPMTGNGARALLRGAPPLANLRALVTRSGAFADMLVLGWPGLYALSPRMSSGMRELAGFVLIPLAIDGGPDGYAVLGVTGGCGRVDYGKSVEVERMDAFVLLRGLYGEEPKVEVDFAIPDNREAVLISSRTSSRLQTGAFSNVQLVPLDEVEFHMSLGMLSRDQEK